MIHVGKVYRTIRINEWLEADFDLADSSAAPSLRWSDNHTEAEAKVAFFERLVEVLAHASGEVSTPVHAEPAN